MNLVMIGTGYVGLVSGACFAEFGVQVTCVDRDRTKIDNLNKGLIPIYEPGLDELVSRNRAQGRLTFTTDLASAMGNANVVMIAVGTPMRQDNGEADLQYVFNVVRDIVPALQGYVVVATKSTVPVGTGHKVRDLLKELAPHADVDVVSNPEFLREGEAIGDFMHPDRVIVGAESERAVEVMRQLYRPLDLKEVPLVFTSVESAELTKYASNAFLATKITFVNQIADLCEISGANVEDVTRGMGLDRRIGEQFLHVGPGYGGSCFPKDTIALVHLAKKLGTPMNIAEAVHGSNQKRPMRMVEKIQQAFGGEVRGKTIAILGVTFKPNTDDMRESPSLTIIPELQKRGASIQSYDPTRMNTATTRDSLPHVSWCDNAYQAMEGANGVVLLTEWNEFRALDWQKAKTLLSTPLLIDLRNIYTLKEMEEAGFTYHSLGRFPVKGKGHS